MSLQKWCDAGLLHRHDPSREEIGRLLAKADGDLEQCKLEGISLDWRFIMAYTATLAYANATLAAAGYRTVQNRSPHENAIDSLRFTIKLDERLLRRLHSFRIKRHAAHYELAGSISRSMADEMFELACDLRDRVISWLRGNYPHLLTADH